MILILQNQLKTSQIILHAIILSLTLVEQVCDLFFEYSRGLNLDFKATIQLRNKLKFIQSIEKKGNDQYQLDSDFVKRHAPKELQNHPRVFKCCQNEFIFDFDSKKCIDPIDTDSFPKASVNLLINHLLNTIK